MVAATVPAVYASALLELAQEDGSYQNVVEDCMAIAEVLAGNPELIQRAESPELSRAQVHELLNGIFAERVHQSAMRLLLLLVDRGRLSEASAILEKVGELANEKAGIVPVTVTTAVEIDDSSRASITQALAKLFGDGVVINTQVDPDLRGGLTIHAGDYLIDASVSRRLKELQQRLTDIPVSPDLWDGLQGETA